MFQAHGARRMRLLLVAEDNARIQVTTFFIILLLRAMGGSPIVLVFPVSQICDLTPSLCACRDDCQSGRWRRSGFNQISSKKYVDGYGVFNKSKSIGFYPEIGRESWRERV